MAAPFLAAVAEAAASMVEQLVSERFAASVDTAKSLVAGETPSLQDLSDAVQELGGPSSQTEESPRSAPDGLKPRADGGKPADGYWSDEGGSRHFFPDDNITSKAESGDEEAPSSPSTRAEKTPAEPDGPASEPPGESDRSRAGRVPPRDEPSEQSPGAQDRAERHKTEPPAAPVERREPYESPIAPDVFRTPMEPKIRAAQQAENERSRDLVRRAMENPDWSWVWSWLDEQDRTNQQRVLDSQGRNITLGQHERNQQRELFLLQMETGKLIASSPMAGAGAMYAMMLTSDPHKIHAMAQLFNMAPTPGLPAKPGGPSTFSAPMRAPRRGDRLKSGRHAASERKTTSRSKSRSASTRRKTRTHFDKFGRRVVNGETQPGMRGKIEVPKFGDRDPDFRKASFFDARLPHSKRGSVTGDKDQFEEAMIQLKRVWKADPKLKDRFTRPEQKRLLEAFGDMSKDGVIKSKVRVPGFRWHHSTDAFGTGRGAEGGGVLQLLNKDVHDYNVNRHVGGRFVTGGNR